MSKLPYTEISRECAEELLKTIKPLVRKEGVLYTIAPVDPFKIAFRWSPQFVERVDMNQLRLVEAIRTYHPAGYIGLFKPGIAEVLAQIPEDLRPHVTAFEIVTSQYQSVYDDVCRCETSDGLYGHWAVTLLYGPLKEGT